MPNNDDDDDRKMPATEDDEESSSSSSEDEEVEAAVLSRSKRSTQGRRLTSLVGKALEEDETFWGHDTWNDSDNDSFRADDDADAVDQFDSDFDDSEDDQEAQDQAEAEAADAELAQQEKKSKQRKPPYQFAKAARDMARGVGSNAKVGRIVGEGDNAGLVLNLPTTTTNMFAAPGVVVVPGPAVATPAVVPTAAKAAPSVATAAPSHTANAVTTHPHPPAAHASSHAAASKSKLTATAAARRPPRRATQQSKYSSRFRAARSHTDNQLNNNASTHSSSAMDAVPPSDPTTNTGLATAHTHHTKRKLTAAERAGEKRKRHRTDFTQEELLLEAIQTTAPENHRWLLGRQRASKELELHEQHMSTKTVDKKQTLVQRSHSKRGTLNVVSFLDMDALPAILTSRPTPQPPTPLVCVISGRPARYRCPQSLLPYADAAAFRELRARLKDGRLKPLNTPPPDTPPPPPQTTTTTPNGTHNNNNDYNNNNDKPVKTATTTAKPTTKPKAARKTGTKRKSPVHSNGDTVTAKPPVKRGRGRPRKHPRPDDTVPSINNAVAAESAVAPAATEPSSAAPAAEPSSATPAAPSSKASAAAPPPSSQSVTPTKPVSTQQPQKQTPSQTKLFASSSPSTPITPPPQPQPKPSPSRSSPRQPKPTAKIRLLQTQEKPTTVATSSQPLAGALPAHTKE